MIDLTYTITFPEYLAAQRLYVRRQLPWVRRLPWMVVAVVMAGLALLFDFSDHWRLSLDSIILLLIALVAFIFIVLVLRPLVFRYTMKRRYAAEFASVDRIKAHIDDAGIQTSIAGMGSSNLEWTAFSCWEEDSQIIALIGGAAVKLFPRRELSEVQLSELRALIAAHIPRS